MTTFLVSYFIAFMAVAFVLRSYMVYRATGINPVVRHAPDSAHMYVGMLFGALILGVTATLAVQAIAETPQAYLLPLPPFHVHQAWVGIALMVAAFLVLALAQMQMGRSWRIGIDAKNKTDLVTHGLFGLSRNPIFLAMQVSLLGLFLCLPNVGTLLVMVVSHIAIQFQVRLEEGHLVKLHGERFEAYCRHTRRWL